MPPLSTSTDPGSVTLLGAGPGDPELLTIKGLKALQNAELILYDQLVSNDILALASPHAEKIYVGKAASRHSMAQEDIGQLMVDQARAGRRVLRLKGGDGFIFGRGGEEAEVLAQAGIAFEVIPGITAAQGASACTGIPLTHRDHARALVLATGHLRQNQTVDLDWEVLARPMQTVVIYMGLGTLPIISRELVAHGLPAHTPAALVERASMPEQRCLTGTIATLPALALEHQLKSPTVIVIGAVVDLHKILNAPSAPTAVRMTADLGPLRA